MTKISRSTFLRLVAGAAGAVALPAAPRIASAQSYPARPVRGKVVRAANIKPE